MDYQTARTGQEVEFVLRGKLTTNDHKKFRDMVHGEACNNAKNVVLNMKDIEFIDSAGIGMLLYANKLGGHQGWNLVLAQPSSTVRKMVDICKLDKVIVVRD